MHPTLRRPVLLAILALLMTLMGATPTAGAHGVLDEEGPVLVGNLQSLITARNMPASVSAELLENGYVLRLVNHSSQDITAHVFGADAGIGTEPPRVPAGVTQLWIGAPSAVTDEDTHAAERVKAGGPVRAWAVELTDADGGQFTVRGVISRLAAPSPAWLVAGVLAILAVVALGALRRPARSAPAAGSELKVRVPRVPIGVALACAMVGLAVETTATLWARAAGEACLRPCASICRRAGHACSVWWHSC